MPSMTLSDQGKHLGPPAWRHPGRLGRRLDILPTKIVQTRNDFPTEVVANPVAEPVAHRLAKIVEAALGVPEFRQMRDDETPGVVIRRGDKEIAVPAIALGLKMVLGGKCGRLHADRRRLPVAQTAEYCAALLAGHESQEVHRLRRVRGCAAEVNLHPRYERAVAEGALGVTPVHRVVLTGIGIGKHRDGKITDSQQGRRLPARSDEHDRATADKIRHGGIAGPRPESRAAHLPEFLDFPERGDRLGRIVAPILLQVALAQIVRSDHQPVQEVDPLGQAVAHRHGDVPGLRHVCVRRICHGLEIEAVRPGVGADRGAKGHQIAVGAGRHIAARDRLHQTPIIGDPLHVDVQRGGVIVQQVPWSKLVIIPSTKVSRQRTPARGVPRL